MRRFSSLLLVALFFCWSACTKPNRGTGAGSESATKIAPPRARPQPPAKKAAPPKTALPDSAFAIGISPTSAEIPAFAQPAKLAVEPSRALFEKLIAAHYDAERLGLKRVGFRLVFSSVKTATKVEAMGVWRAGSAAEIKITRVTREGKERPGADTTGRQIHTALTYRMRRLLDGLGNGFLSRRLAHFRGLEGAVKKISGGKLSVAFKEESGVSTVVVGKGYRVESVRNRSPKGVTRQMTYEHDLDDGRNLVKSARMTVQIDEGAKIKRRTRTVLLGAHETEFSISYVKVGSFRLPLRLVKKMPGVKDEIRLELKY